MSPLLRILHQVRAVQPGCCSFSSTSTSNVFSHLSTAEEQFSLSIGAPAYTPTPEDIDAAVDLLNSLWSGSSVPARSYRPVHLLLRSLLKYPSWVVPQLPSGRVLKLSGPPVSLPAFSTVAHLQNWFNGFQEEHSDAVQPVIDLAKNYRILSGQGVVSFVWGDAFLRGETFRLDESITWNPKSSILGQSSLPKGSLSYPGSQFGAHLWDFTISIPTETVLANGYDALKSDTISVMSYPYYLLACKGTLDIDGDSSYLHIYTATDLALEGRRRFAESINQPESAISVQRISLPNVDASLRSEENGKYSKKLEGVSIIYAHTEDPTDPETFEISAEDLKQLITMVTEEPSA